MTESIINAAVIGVGRMGGHHARNYAGMTNHFKLVAVVDKNAEAAARAAETYGCRAFSSIDEMLAANRGLYDRFGGEAHPLAMHLGGDREQDRCYVHTLGHSIGLEPLRQRAFRRLEIAHLVPERDG